MLKPLFGTVVGLLGIYLSFISLLTIPKLQDHVIYLHKVTLTWFQDVNIPEQWGFLRNQVTPFHLKTSDGETLHAWHVLPLDVYQQHEAELIEEPTGLCQNVENSLSFELLRDDPTAKLVIYFHGAAGTLGSGWRPQSYRALSAAVPNLHVLAIDYRGYGSSSGWPSESGMLTDALTLTEFAMGTAQIPAERIVVFAQSLGTAVALSLSHKLALEAPPILFAGTVLVAPMADVETSTQTYKIAGTIPLLSPMAVYPPLLTFFNRFIISKWPSKAKIADFIRHLDSADKDGRRNNYDITLIHAEDDWDMPWIHSEILFAHAVRSMRGNAGFTKDVFEEEKAKRKLQLGAGGWVVEWWGGNGIVREQIVKHGLHDRIMSYPVVGLAIARAFTNTGTYQLGGKES
ncbi:alpha/beta-hydrolase [Paraphaeosphaeria sporulosa]|uniref:Alpha/beta-hydrolase n=1 Tax=Paraphaeosphaeria sporulosa TaxID=1460663 RepID=A0A177BWN7_9PLEO|nr:alpha/beta-hydrolase [Paraphaeosphaeria sporulosa]OAF98776.1 alpha/beta-hydrolase [Paraphaeosphaeria sporulosa]